jgi:molecular chaperone DnaK
MGYQLGIDLGTTYTAAAVARDGRVEICALGTASPVIPSVVLLRTDGEVLVGEVAVRRGLEEPTRVAREFKRRLGDPTPLVLGGTPYGAEAVMGQLLRAVVRMVAEREGSVADRVVLTHPANFGPYKLDMMREVARLAGLDLGSTVFVSEPQAAAVSYAQRNRVEPGDVVAVYDFGGGTFDAALLQRRDEGFVLLGRPEGMERFGGIDIDAAILSHIDESLGGVVRELDPDDPAVIAAVSRLKDECRAAKEALAADTDTSVAVSLPSVQTRVRLTRRELEDMVRPRLVETFEALDRSVRSAGLTMGQVSRILLVGGSSRMPLVAEMLQRESGRPVAVDAHPKYAIALGAAAYGAGVTVAVSPTAAPAVPAAPAAPAAPVAPVAPVAATPPPAPPAPPAPPVAPPTTAMPATHAPTTVMPSSGPPTGSFQAAAGVPPTPPANNRNKFILGGAAAAAAVAIIAFVATRGGDDDGKRAVTTESTPEETTAPSTTPEASVTSVAETVAPIVVTTPPETTPPETVPPPVVPQPLTLEQLQFALVTPAELDSSWIPGVFEEDGDLSPCNVVLTDTSLNEAGVAFNRTVAGLPQQLSNAASTYPDSATALAALREFENALRACTEFDVVDPASGETIRFFPQVFNEPANAACQAAISARIDSFVVSTGAGLTSGLFLVQVCGNNANSTSLVIPSTNDVFSPDLQSELGTANLTSLNKLITLPVVP